MKGLSRTAIALFMVMISLTRGLLRATTPRHCDGRVVAVKVLRDTALRAITSKTSTTTRKGDFWQARDNVWRPTINDVERISWGKPARRKGTGSRDVPHRLNEEERATFDRARQKGFLEVAGSAWRAQRREAPLLNTHRSLCDARGQASIVLHKGNTGIDDNLVVDLSPLRNPQEFERIATVCLNVQSGGEVIFQDAIGLDSLENNQEDDHEISVDTDNPWETRPIYQLPPFCIAWELPRSDAKALAKKMAELFDSAEGKRAPSKKPIGVKPGRSRRHGGYGIG